MSLTGKAELELQIKCSADEFFGVFKSKAHRIPSACSQRVKSIEVHEGDWETEGSVKHWNFVVDGNDETAKEKIQVDEENKTVIFEIVEGDMLKLYKSYKVYLQIIPSPTGQGGKVKWTAEYEKANEDVPSPNKYLEFGAHLTTNLDAYLLKA
ncbi:Bet v I/Major latex protein [Dillenia turbinata]|uniref:Bet v I/Major latex protein n=1 Tax=Dillenia turbinata TaxID=194707 RepID=A0AAN8ZAT2_9MAGN